jgi:hypothetical protein
MGLGIVGRPGGPIWTESGVKVEGREVTLPVEVRDASAATVIWEVDAAAVRALLPTDDVEVVQTEPGRAQFAVALVDYRDNDLGAYLEIGFIAFVRPTSGGEDGTFILRLPVDGEFTCAAGREVWGFPKTVEDIAFDYAVDHLTATLQVDGELVMRLRVPRGGEDHMPQLTNASYTVKDGRLHCTRFTQGGDRTGIGLGPDGVELELGEHPWAKELAGLGLPAPAVLSTWNERMRATFEEALPV